jgi:hypothetical protein
VTQLSLLHSGDKSNIYFEASDIPAVTFSMRQCALIQFGSEQYILDQSGNSSPMSNEEQTSKQLAERFAEAAEKSFDAVQRGAWAENNRWVKKQVAAFKRITELGIPARDALLELLDDENLVIAKSAAVFSLEFAPERSILVLERISREPGFLGFEARQALARWQEGSWQLE